MTDVVHIIDNGLDVIDALQKALVPFVKACDRLDARAFSRSACYAAIFIDGGPTVGDFLKLKDAVSDVDELVAELGRLFRASPA